MIYFIECMGFVKIGKADDVLRRLLELQTGNQHELKLLGVIDAPDDEELRLHAAFWSQHYRGEWFHLTKAIKEFIDKECIKSEFDKIRPKTADAKFKLSAVSFDQWATSQLVQDADSTVSIKFLHEHYVRWCKENGLPFCERTERFGFFINKKGGPVEKFGATPLRIGKRNYYAGIGLANGEREDLRTGMQKTADAIRDILRTEFQKNGGYPIDGQTIRYAVRNAGITNWYALYLAANQAGIRIEETPAKSRPNIWHAPSSWLS